MSTDRTMVLRVPMSASDGPLLPAEGLALLVGASVDEVRAYLHTEAGKQQRLPQDWLHAGRRRALELKVNTGQNDMVSALTYWAEKDHGARLVIEYEQAPGGAQ